VVPVMLGVWTLDTAVAVEDADNEERIAQRKE
jgi:hypothetical protein